MEKIILTITIALLSNLLITSNALANETLTNDYIKEVVADLEREAEDDQSFGYAPDLECMLSFTEEERTENTLVDLIGMCD